MCVTVGAALETANGDVFVGAWVDTASSLDSALSIQPRPQRRSRPTRGQRATPRRAPWLGERFDTWPGRRAHPVSSRFRGCTRIYSLVTSIAICAGDGISIDAVRGRRPNRSAAAARRWHGDAIGAGDRSVSASRMNRRNRRVVVIVCVSPQAVDQRSRLIDATCPHKRAAVSERHLEEVPAPASTQ